MCATVCVLDLVCVKTCDKLSVSESALLEVEGLRITSASAPHQDLTLGERCKIFVDSTVLASLRLCCVP